MSAWWSSIGQEIDRRWRSSGRLPEGFPDVAADVLSELPAPGGQLAADALAWLAEAELPEQRDVGSGFGQPALTVFHGDGFILSLLFWFDETITIHDHRFSGAFTLIEGQSLQNVYEFEPEERISQGIEAGTLRCTTVETLAPGDVRLIPPGPGLIHSNVHFGHPAPTLSLVARTLVKAGDPQRFYSHGGLAFLNEERSTDTAMRLRGFTASCRISPEAGVDYLRRVLAGAAPEQVLSYAMAATGTFGSSLYLDPLIAGTSLGASDRARRLLGAYAAQVARGMAALGELRRCTDGGDRLLLSLVAAGTDWDAATGVLCSATGSAGARGALWPLVSGLVERARSSGGPSLCSLSEAAGRYVASMASLEGVAAAGPAAPSAGSARVGSVGAQPGAPPGSASAGPPVPPTDRVYTELVTHRMLGPLFRFLLGERAGGD